MDKFIKTNSVCEVYGYEPFPADSVPKVLMKRHPNKTQTFEYSGDDKDAVYASLKASRSTTTILPCWLVKDLSVKQKVEPHGVAFGPHQTSAGALGWPV